METEEALEVLLIHPNLKAAMQNTCFLRICLFNSPLESAFRSPVIRAAPEHAKLSVDLS